MSLWFHNLISAWWPEPLRLVLFLVGMLSFVGLNAAYLVWVERKGAARFQRRPGPNEVGFAGLLQPIADALKLMSKQLIVPDGVDRTLFRAAPLLMMSPVLMSLAVIPFSETLAARNLNVGLLMIFALGSINVMAVMLGGWSSRNKYAIISAARVVSQNVAYEIPMLLVVTTMIMVTGTMNLNEIVQQQAGAFWHWNLFKVWVNPLMPVTFIIFYICMLAETNRAPFDMAEAESELVAGAYTEYSGMGFGVFFMAEYANILLGCSLATVLFLGGWHSPIGILPGVVWFLLKLYLLVFSVVWVRWTFPRTQFYGLLNLSWKILIPVSLFTLILSSAMMKLFKVMKNALKEIILGFNSLLTGMRITLGQFFKPSVTVQYPHESLKMPKRFRGHIELVTDPATGQPKCFVCKLCEKACPSDCITVEGVKPEGARRKMVNHYRLDFTKCSLCGSCVEACRDGAIRFSREFNLASTNKDDFIMDLFKRLEGEAQSRLEAGAPSSGAPSGTATPASSEPMSPSPNGKALAATAEAPVTGSTPDTRHVTLSAEVPK